MDEDPTKVEGIGRGRARADDKLDRYRIEAVIGRGGMGEVLSARDDEIGRSVAIKVIQAEEPPPAAVARFVREARIQGQLEHPSIVPVHELARDATGRPYFVMKLLAGTTLKDALQRPAEFTRHRLLRAFTDVCLAIELAHTRGVIHRDLKPANIMLGDFGEVYVLDWGIARVVDDVDTPSAPRLPTDADGKTQAGAVMGTPGYMSPEQKRGESKLDARTDVFALGTILREILVEPIPELEAACVAATQPDRERRIASARALGEIVQRYLDGDRDLALRRDLARQEFTTAQSAFASGDRKTAIAAAARALALDPHLREAADLVGRLMIEPPKQMPAEVVAELASRDRAELTTQARHGLLAVMSYFLYFPIFYLAGFRAVWQVVVPIVLVVATIVTILVMIRRPSRPLSFATLVGNTVMLAIVAYQLTPFVIGPAIALYIAMAYALLPQNARGWVIFVMTAAAILGPFAVMRGRLEVIGNAFVLHTSAGRLDTSFVIGGLVVFVLVSLSTSILMVRGMANDRRAMQRALYLQTWQLRQLVPVSRSP